jgi:uncharacterized membrane protein SirB2
MMLLKHLHISLAMLSIGGFFLRGIWHSLDSPLARAPFTRWLPHLVDTLLLISALGLLYGYQWQPLYQPWLHAKLVALLLYIGLGVYAFRIAPTKTQRSCAWLLAFTSALYIIAVAITKTPLPLLQ